MSQMAESTVKSCTIDRMCCEVQRDWKFQESAGWSRQFDFTYNTMSDRTAMTIKWCPTGFQGISYSGQVHLSPVIMVLKLNQLGGTCGWMGTRMRLFIILMLVSVRRQLVKLPPARVGSGWQQRHRLSEVVWSTAEEMCGLFPLAMVTLLNKLRKPAAL